MEGVNGLDAGVPLPLTKELNENGAAAAPHTYYSRKVDYHLNNLLASHLSNPDLTTREIAEASRATAASASLAAKAARATALEKAAAAAKAVAAAKSALDLIASFPNQAAACQLKKKPEKASELLYSKDDELPISNSSSSVEHKNDQSEVPIGVSERPNTEHATSKRLDFNGHGMELVSDDRLIESATASGGGEKAKEVTKKRGRPKSICNGA